MAPKRKPRRKPSVPARPLPAGEDRRGEAVTVAWTLSLLAALLAQLLGAGLRLLAGLIELPGNVSVVPGLMLLVGLICGCLCLLLTPLVYRFRRAPPPPVITALAITVSLLPLLIVLLSSLP